MLFLKGQIVRVAAVRTDYAITKTGSWGVVERDQQGVMTVDVRWQHLTGGTPDEKRRYKNTVFSVNASDLILDPSRTTPTRTMTLEEIAKYEIQSTIERLHFRQKFYTSFKNQLPHWRPDDNTI